MRRRWGLKPGGEAMTTQSRNGFVTIIMLSIMTGTCQVQYLSLKYCESSRDQISSFEGANSIYILVHVFG